MKIPTGKYLKRKTLNSLLRFPFSILFSLISTVLFIIITEQSVLFNESSKIFRFMFTSILGIPLFVSIQLICERMEVTARIKLLLKIAGLILLAFYFLTIPVTDYPKTYIRLTAYLFMLILCISFAPFIGIRQNFPFWRYNSIIIMRFLRTCLYGIILYVAISLAFVAIEQLFDVSLGEKLYFQLFIVISLFFCTWFFLSAIPMHFNKLSLNSDYSNALKIFVQFILIPIVILYSIILYAYFIKIIAVWEWPHGWVASLILGYSLLSIFTFLIIYPIRKSPTNTYIRFFSRFFPYLLWPLIIILFVSIIKRISDYGITENRYFVLIMGIWLTFIMTYLLMTRLRDIKIIPVSLAIIIFLSVTGPWNAFMISKTSQLNCFEKILFKYEKIKEQTYKSNDEIMSYEDYNSLLSHSNYVLSNYGYKPFVKIFPDFPDTIVWDSVFVYEYSITNPVMDYMHIEYTEDSTANLSSIYIGKEVKDTEKIYNISEYDLFCPFEIKEYNYFDTIGNIKHEFIYPDSVRIIIETDSAYISIYSGKSLLDKLNLSLIVTGIPQNAFRDSLYSLNPRYLSVEKIIQQDIKIYYSFDVISGNYFNKELKNIDYLKGHIFIKIR